MRLQEVRKARDMTQAEFAKKLGVSQASISDWENGKKTPSLKTFIRAGTVLEWGRLKNQVRKPGRKKPKTAVPDRGILDIRITGAAAVWLLAAVKRKPVLVSA